MVETNVENLRAPFVLVENDTYYLYGTGVENNDWENTIWACCKNENGTLVLR